MGILQIPIQNTIVGKSDHLPLMYFRRKTLMDLRDFTFQNLLKSHQDKKLSIMVLIAFPIMENCKIIEWVIRETIHV